MSRAKQSMVVWAGYVYVLGAVLLLVPNVLLDVFGIAETDEVWIRVVGMTVVLFGILYTGIVRADARDGYVASVIARGFAVVTLLILAATTGPWQLALFAAIDLAGATWTWAAIRADDRQRSTNSA